MKTIAEKIRLAVTQAEPVLSGISPDSASEKEHPASWSKKEILGHLIDSAANNHQRFVRGAQNVAVDFPPYDQNRWVEIQQYNKMDWPDLIGLFVRYNLHISRVLETLPQDVLDNPCNIGKGNTVALRFVIEDYLRHLQHHIEKILEGTS